MILDVELKRRWRSYKLKTSLSLPSTTTLSLEAYVYVLFFTTLHTTYALTFETCSASAMVASTIDLIASRRAGPNFRRVVFLEE